MANNEHNNFPTHDPDEPTDSGLMRDILARTREVSARIVERVRQVSADFDRGSDGTSLPPQTN
jgi:hypothetical protein